MIKPDLILHIGLPKTGTTTIQHFLRINHEILIKGGVLYPQSGRTYEAHHQLAAAFQDRMYDWVPQAELCTIFDQLQAEISQSDAKKVIISSEILTWMDRPEVLLEKLDPFFDFIRVVIFLRRQDLWLESAYRHDLTTGDFNGAAEDYVKIISRKLDYLEIIKSWQPCPTSTDIKIAVLDGTNRNIPLQRQFLSLCNISWNEKFRMNDDANTTLTRDAIEFLRIGPESRRISRYHNELRKILSGYSKMHPDPPGYRYSLSPKERRKLLAEHFDINQQIASSFLPERAPFLFDSPPIDDQEPWEAYPGLSQEKTIDIANFICREAIKKNLNE